MSSTRFEPEGSSSGRQLYIQAWYSVFYMHRYKQSSLEFKTCRGHQKLKIKILI